MTAAVLTAVYGRYDTPRPACDQHGIEVDWVLVTDDDNLEVPGWRIIYEPRPGMHPNRAAKAPKLHPWRYTSADASVWIDASFTVTSPDFVRSVLAAANPVAQFVHPWRDCCYDEAAICLQIPHKVKYGDEEARLHAQVADYRERGHPEHWGLWATGVIARHHTPEVRDASWRWDADVCRYSRNDQVAHPVAMREAGLRPSLLEGDHMANPWLAFHPSARHHGG